MAEDTAPQWVTLVSSDGFEFIIQREAAVIAGTIRRMLDPKSMWHDWILRREMLMVSTDGFKEAVSNTCRFENIP